MYHCSEKSVGFGDIFFNMLSGLPMLIRASSKWWIGDVYV